MAELKATKAGFTRPLVGEGASTQVPRPGRNCGTKRLKPGHDTQPYVLIIGGSRAPLAWRAPQALGVPTIIAERTARRRSGKRYKSLCLHDGLVRPSALYRLSKNWPVFSPKDKIGDWLEITPR
jgi:putative flavoprotein involved in K+ transport